MNLTGRQIVESVSVRVANVCACVQYACSVMSALRRALCALRDDNRAIVARGVRHKGHAPMWWRVRIHMHTQHT